MVVVMVVKWSDRLPTTLLQSEFESYLSLGAFILYKLLGND